MVKPKLLTVIFIWILLPASLLASGCNAVTGHSEAPITTHRIIVGLSPALHTELQQNAAREHRLENWKIKIQGDIRWIRFVGLSNGLIELDSAQEIETLTQTLQALEGVQFAEPDLIMRAR